MPSHKQDQSLSRAILTTVWIFQLVVAGPIFIWLGLLALLNLYYTFDRVYDFVAHLCTFLLAAGIFFIVLVQRKLADDAVAKRLQLTIRFEVAKAVLATALWVWLIMDAIFGPEDRYGYYGMRGARIVASAISAVLLL